MKLLSKPAASALTTCVVAGLLASSAAAQGVGSVVESRPFTPGQTPANTSSASVSNNDALQLLLDQNRQLQAEVQALRGMVEEQGFEIRKLQRDSLSRYTDVDERLRSLETGSITSTTPVNPIDTGSTLSNRPSNVAQSPATSTAADSAGSTVASAPAPATSTSRPIASRNNRTTSSSRGTLEPAVLSEQQLYQMAYDSVINSNFERSIAEFDQYLSIYPDGRFVTNGHYWKGLAFLNLTRYDEARESFEIILDQYPDSAKFPDAMYGLAQAYQGLGNIPQARQLLNDIKRRFPNTGVANLADTRLLSLD
ncbi:MAG: tetratricopeptide repeat protein [Pseudomonadales bacterium]|nr:tetratricopeptide repeat protein [Pseudomonadales bacterium]